MADELTVRWNLPDELKEDLKYYVGFLIHLCPGWVNDLAVTFDAQPESEHRRTTAYIEADYKYRRVCLTILPTWVNLDREQRKGTIVHESVHILTAPVDEFFRSSMDEMLTDEAHVLRILQAGWRIANEAVTEDTALAIQKATDASWNRGWDDCLAEYGLD